MFGAANAPLFAMRPVAGEGRFAKRRCRPGSFARSVRERLVGFRAARTALPGSGAAAEARSRSIFRPKRRRAILFSTLTRVALPYRVPEEVGAAGRVPRRCDEVQTILPSSPGPRYGDVAVTETVDASLADAFPGAGPAPPARAIGGCRSPQIRSRQLLPEGFPKSNRRSRRKKAAREPEISAPRRTLRKPLRPVANRCAAFASVRMGTSAAAGRDPRDLPGISDFRSRGALLRRRPRQCSAG